VNNHQQQQQQPAGNTVIHRYILPTWNNDVNHQPTWPCSSLFHFREQMCCCCL